MKKRILILGAGGSPATNFVRSLRNSLGSYYLVGTDCNKYYLMRAETDEKYLIPPADDSDYLKVLNRIIEKERIDFIHAQNDIEVGKISELRDKLKAKTFLPSENTVRTCQNKWLSMIKWKEREIIQPKAYFLNNEEDLKKAFESFGRPLWIREESGAGGRGSLRAETYEQTKAWIDFHKGWGKFIAAEYLSPNSVTWMSIWKDGELIVAQGRKRLYWELGKISPSGISGATGGAITVSDKKLDQIAIKSIKAIDPIPNGIFSVDLTYNKEGVPVPTEINIGRFFTTHEFFSRAGLNMPHIFVSLGLGENPRLPEKRLNPLPDNLLWIRGMDFLPIFTELKNLEFYEEKLKKLKYEI